MSTNPILHSASTSNREATPSFVISACSGRDMFNTLLYYLEHASSYKSNGYRAPFPSYPQFKELEEHPETIPTVDKEPYFKRFVDEIYKPLDLTPLQKLLTDNLELLKTALDSLRKLKEKWGFKISPQYTIFPTLYGVGGSYNASLGYINLKIYVTGPQTYQLPPFPETIIHEMIHIGIEDIIVKQFRLTQWETEGLVDLIAELYLNIRDFLPNYKNQIPDSKIQPADNKRIREFITLEKICDNLPEAIKEYVTRYPRDQKQGMKL